MKISVVLTILNEEKTIGGFLNSLYKQSLLPGEVVIVDGGSVDKTCVIINDQLSSASWRINNMKLIKKPGANRSVGRNIGIEKAKGDVIAVTDAGCILDKDWLKNITKPFDDKKVMAVAGFYKPICKNIFQKCLAPYFCTMERGTGGNRREKKGEKVEFLPSSRSVAFRKKVWEKAGGYPQNLNYCEDLVFDQKVIKTGYKFYFEPSAIVYWPMKNSIKSVFKQFYNYAYGDGQIFFSDLQTHSIKILTVYGRYLIFLILIITVLLGKINILILLIVFTLYLVWSIGKNYRYVKDFMAIYYLPVIQLTSDLAVTIGSINGIIHIPVLARNRMTKQSQIK